MFNIVLTNWMKNFYFIQKDGKKTNVHYFAFKLLSLENNRGFRVISF